MLQIATFWDIYSISPPIYILCVYINQIIIYICTCSTRTFFDNFFIEDAMPEKALKYALFQKKNKNFC